MCLFLKKKRKKTINNEILPIEQIAEIMYNKNLSFFDTVVKVIYSRDKTKRYVLLKRINDGNYLFLYEELMVFDSDELQWRRTDSANPQDALPAYWCTKNSGVSLFGTLDEVYNSIQFEPEYIEYFS